MMSRLNKTDRVAGLLPRKMRKMLQRKSIFILIILVFVMGLIPPPVVESAAPSRTIDDAMLLMISSHSMSEEEDGPAQTNLQKIGRMQNVYHAASTRTLKSNEIAFLRAQVRDFCLQGKALVTAHYAGEDECIRLGMMEKECGKRTEWLDEQAEALERARRRRERYRGIGGMFNRIGDSIRRARPVRRLDGSEKKLFRRWLKQP